MFYQWGVHSCHCSVSLKGKGADCNSHLDGTNSWNQSNCKCSPHSSMKYTPFRTCNALKELQGPNGGPKSKEGKISFSEPFQHHLCYDVLPRGFPWSEKQYQINASKKAFENAPCKHELRWENLTLLESCFLCRPPHLGYASHCQYAKSSMQIFVACAAAQS